MSVLPALVLSLDRISNFMFFFSAFFYISYLFLSLSLAGGSEVLTGTAENDVLKALSQIIDPDFGTDIVSCGFVKDLHIDEALGEVI